MMHRAARCYKIANAKVNRTDADAIKLPNTKQKTDQKEDNCNIVCMKKSDFYIHRLKSIK